jgi:NADP-dependent 3-hydroxy acid dehydrogenase YdfG
MSVIAVMGAGPGMGLAIARTFGAQGYKVALLSRSLTKQEELLAALAKEDIEAAGFRVNVLDHQSIVSGLLEVKQRFGSIDVLEYSPSDSNMPLISITEVNHDSIQSTLDFNVHGALSAVQSVLPDMLARHAH